jgi:hypothetical protein
LRLVQDREHPESGAVGQSLGPVEPMALISHRKVAPESVVA